MDLKNLTREEKETLRKQLDAERKAEESRIQAEREAYKELVDRFVREKLYLLRMLSDQMVSIKAEIFADAQTLIQTKNELFKAKSGRRSDTFTSSDGLCSISLGYRVYDGWDDTVEQGIAKVKNYLASLSKDDETAALVDTIMGLLAKDHKGSLKANKVLELEKLAIKSQDPEFIDGMSIIRQAYLAVPSCKFISVELRDEQGKSQKLPLSMSAIDETDNG